MTSFARNSRFDLDDDTDHKSSYLERETTNGSGTANKPSNKSRHQFLKPIEPNLEQNITLGKSLNIPNPHCDPRDQQKAQQRLSDQNVYSDLRFNTTTYIQDLTRQIEQIWKDNEYKPFHCTPFKRLLRSPLMQHALENNLLPDRIQKRLDNDIKSQTIRNLINYLSRGKNCSHKSHDVEFTPEQLSQRYDYVDSDADDGDIDSRNRNASDEDQQQKNKATNNRSIHLQKSDRFAILSDDNAVKNRNQDDKNHIQHRKSWATIAATSAHSLANHAPSRPTQSNPQPRPRTVFHAHHVDASSLLPETAIDHFTERQEGKEQQDRIKQAQAAELQWKTQINRQQLQHKSASQATYAKSTSNNDQKDPQDRTRIEPPQDSSGARTTDNNLIVKPGGIAFEVPMPTKLTKQEQKTRQDAFQESIQHRQHPRHQRDSLVHFLHFQHDLAHSLMKFNQDSNEAGTTTAKKEDAGDSTLAPKLPQNTWSLNDLKYITLLLNKNKAHYLYAIQLRKHLQNEHHDVTNNEIDYDAGEIDSLLDEYYYNQQRISEIVSTLLPHLPATERAPKKVDHRPSDIYDKDFYNYAELLDKFPQLDDHEPQHVLHDSDTPIIMYNSCYKQRYADPQALGLADADREGSTEESEEEQDGIPSINPDAKPFTPPSDPHLHYPQPAHHYPQQQYQQPYYHPQHQQYWNRSHPPRSRRDSYHNRYQQQQQQQQQYNYYQPPYHQYAPHWQQHNYNYDIPPAHPHNRPMDQSQTNQVKTPYYHDQHQHDSPNKDMILLSVDEYHRLLQLSKNQGASATAAEPSISTAATAAAPTNDSTEDRPVNTNDSQYSYPQAGYDDGYYTRGYHQPYHHSGRRASIDSYRNQRYYQQPLPNTGDIYQHEHAFANRHQMYQLPQAPPYPPQHPYHHQAGGYNIQRPSSGASTSSIGVDGLTRKERRKQWYRNYLDKHPEEKQRFLQDHYFKKHLPSNKTQSSTSSDEPQQPRRRASLFSVDNPDYYQDNEDFCIY